MPESYTYVNTRGFMRMRARCLVRYQRLGIPASVESEASEAGKSSGGTQIARTEDMSASGLLLVLPEWVPVGEKLDLWLLYDPDQPPVHAVAQAVRCWRAPMAGKKFFVGVAFEKLDLAIQQKLAQHLEVLSKTKEGRKWVQSDPTRTKVRRALGPSR